MAVDECLFLGFRRPRVKWRRPQQSSKFCGSTAHKRHSCESARKRDVSEVNGQQHEVLADSRKHSLRTSCLFTFILFLLQRFLPFRAKFDVAAFACEALCNGVSDDCMSMDG